MQKMKSNLQIAHNIVLRGLQQSKAPPDVVEHLPLLGCSRRGGLPLDDAAERRREHVGCFLRGIFCVEIYIFESFLI